MTWIIKNDLPEARSSEKVFTDLMHKMQIIIILFHCVIWKTKTFKVNLSTYVTISFRINDTKIKRLNLSVFFAGSAGNWDDATRLPF